MSTRALACLQQNPQRVKVTFLVQEPNQTNTKYKELFFTSAQNQRQSAQARREANHNCENEWMRSDSLLYLYKINHKAYEPSQQ